MFQGFRVRLADVERLRKLQKTLMAKKVSQEEMKTVLKAERRKAEKELQKEKKRVCFHCR